MKNGFHILEKDVVDEKKLSTFRPISIIKFLKIIKNKEVEQFEDYTVYGLEDLFSNIEKKVDLEKYIRKLLVERSPFLVNKGCMFQFLIKRSNIEIWENKPIIKLIGGDNIQLHKIFGSMESPEDHPNWFWHQLNVES